MSDISALTRERVGPDVRESSGPVIIDVWGPQCVPCLALAPTFEALATEYDDSATFFKLEAPKNRMACVDLKVVSLPTFLCYQAGVERARLTGDVSADELTSWVAQLVSANSEVRNT